MIARAATLLTIGTATLLLMASGAPIAGQEPQAQAPEAQAERTIYVTVLGPEGPMMSGLNASDFRVQEDNIEREVTAIKPAEVPLSAVLMIDTNPQVDDYVQDMRKAVVDYARVLFSMAPDARLALAEFSGVGMITQKFTSSLEEIEDRAQKIVANTQSEAVFNEGLMAAADELQREDTPRRAIVTINMEPQAEHSTVRIPNVASKVRESGASVFSIAIQLGAERDANRDALMNGVTTNSGGLRMQINAVTALEGLLGTIAAISAAQWAVTFTRPADAAPAERTAAIVTLPGARVLTNAWAKGEGRPVPLFLAPAVAR